MAEDRGDAAAGKKAREPRRSGKRGLAGTKEGEGQEQEHLQSEQTKRKQKSNQSGSQDKAKKTTHVDRTGTLIGVGKAAEIIGTTARTVERWVDDGAILVEDFVDDKYAVFKRDYILRLAATLRLQEGSTYRKQTTPGKKVALKGETDVDMAADGDLLTEAREADL
jgi:hypothetical protein